MKNLINMLMAVTVAAFIFTGCVEDTCDTLVCQNGATCIDNACDCPEGFTGKECEEIIDLCEDVTCEGAQTCDEGVCGCTDGFEGINCDMLAVGKFIGNWDAEDDCPSAGEGMVYAYIPEIRNDDNDQTKAMILNFGNFGDLTSWSATVSGDTISLPLSDAGSVGEKVEGMGIMTEDRNTINWIYTYTNEKDESEECIGVWTKL